MSNTRQPGYYWVKCRAGYWTIGEWTNNDYWYYCGEEGCTDDEDMLQINETRILSPDEIDPIMAQRIKAGYFKTTIPETPRISNIEPVRPPQTVEEAQEMLGYSPIENHLNDADTYLKPPQVSYQGLYGTLSITLFEIKEPLIFSIPGQLSSLEAKGLYNKLCDDMKARKPYIKEEMEMTIVKVDLQYGPPDNR